MNVSTTWVPRLIPIGSPGLIPLPLPEPSPRHGGLERGPYQLGAAVSRVRQGNPLGVSWPRPSADPCLDESCSGNGTSLTKKVRLTYSEDHHTHSPEIREPEGSGRVGYAAIKYAAIVIIVLAAFLAFLAWYIIPRIG